MCPDMEGSGCHGSGYGNDRSYMTVCTFKLFANCWIISWCFVDREQTQVVFDVHYRGQNYNIVYTANVSFTAMDFLGILQMCHVAKNTLVGFGQSGKPRCRDAVKILKNTTVTWSWDVTIQGAINTCLKLICEMCFS